MSPLVGYQTPEKTTRSTQGNPCDSRTYKILPRHDPSPLAPEHCCHKPTHTGSAHSRPHGHTPAPTGPCTYTSQYCAPSYITCPSHLTMHPTFFMTYPLPPSPPPPLATCDNTHHNPNMALGWPPPLLTTKPTPLVQPNPMQPEDEAQNPE